MVQDHLSLYAYEMNGSFLISCVDGNKGFHLLELEEVIWEITLFITQIGLLRFKKFFEKYKKFG